MRNWPKFPLSEHDAHRQAHCDLPAGAFERELGREGFFGPATHMLHSHPPTGWTRWDGPLAPHCFDTGQLPAVSEAGPWAAPVILHNANVQVRFWRCDQAMTELMRNSDGDDVLFVHEGEGEFFCDFGHLSFRDGDYLVIPRGALWRIEPASQVRALLIEASNGAYQIPERGILGPHAQWDMNVVRSAKLDEAFAAQRGEIPWTVRIKRGHALSTCEYPFNPLDAIGWHGDIVAYALNWRDIRPLMSHRYHVPPSAHATFVANGFVICTFVPRPIESDPGALKVPFYHSNEDYDEVLFYHRGNFFSRDNIDRGMITVHPAGFPHGPHPKALRKSMQNPNTSTDEVAVMIDTRQALMFTAALAATENPDYVNSWKETDGAQ